jgi:uncharacterized protein (DUF885 family)
VELKARRLAGLLTLAALLAGAPAQPLLSQDKVVTANAPSATPTQREDSRLMALFRADRVRLAELDPLAVMIRRGGSGEATGFKRIFTDDLDSESLETVQQALADLKAIDRAKLSSERQLSYDAFLRDKREAEQWLSPPIRELTKVRPISHYGGLHLQFPSLIARGGGSPYQREEDYRRALALMQAWPVVTRNIVNRFRQGMASGVVDTKQTVGIMLSQIDTILAQPREQSPFYAPVLKFPDYMPLAKRKALQAAFASTIDASVFPAYRELRRFLAEEYLPKARSEVGLSAMKGGRELYTRTIARETTQELDPEAVHQLGLTEVARIRAEMAKVAKQLAFKGTLAAFFEHMRSNPRFHPKTAKELADGYAAVARKVDALIPQYFSRVPRTKLMIEPYPAYRERFESGASYDEGTPDGAQPGVFLYNSYDLPARRITGITTLYMHEGIPGHHFQISLAQENTRLPEFQRFGGNTAYVEGWALYAETLGFSMGLYTDPLQHWGTLDDEMLRAMRLVVDTGLHHKGWSRDQAIAYMLGNSGMGRSDAMGEVDRYIASPGQAVAYKIGAMTIQRLRRKAETALGPKFDLRAFHDQILGSGALPLPILETKIDRWIASVR